ncbi:hypothetical protein Ancab_028379, partial [Ancistrocladus abbreviatus]
MEEKETTKPLNVNFNLPARYWTDALPIGNGRLGAIIWGGFPSETLNPNEDTVWTGIPGNYTNPKAPEALGQVRKLDDGKFADAAVLAQAKLDGEPSNAGSTTVVHALDDKKLRIETHIGQSYSWQQHLRFRAIHTNNPTSDSLNML